MLTRKHYCFILDSLLPVSSRDWAVQDLARALKRDNPRFDYDKFVGYWNKRCNEQEVKSKNLI